MKNLMHAPSEEWILSTERLISIKYLIQRRPKTYLLSSKILPRLSPHPQARELTTWNLAGCLPLQFLPINAAHPRPSKDSPAACYRMCFPNYNCSASSGGSDGKACTCSAGDLGSIPGSGRSPGDRMAIPSSILGWRIPWTEEPGRQQSMGSQRFGHN